MLPATFGSYRSEPNASKTRHCWMSTIGIAYYRSKELRMPSRSLSDLRNGRCRAGGTTPVFIIGSDTSAAGLHPWNFVEGSLAALSAPDAVAIDRTYFPRLGVTGIGDTIEIRDQKMRNDLRPLLRAFLACIGIERASRRPLPAGSSACKRGKSPGERRFGGWIGVRRIDSG